MSNDKRIERTKDVLCEENISFSQLNLKPATLQGLTDNGFKYPSPIQVKSIPMGLLGLDLILQAKSGTGKTCVFAVLALEAVLVSCKAAQVLVISPTREIALQNMNVIRSVGRHIDNLNCKLFIGGIKVHEDLKNVKDCQIIVGTPGRIKHLIDKNHIQTDSIRLLILDEADMLFTENFQSTMNFIYNSLPMNKQMLTLSATYTEEMIESITKYMNSPFMIRLNSNERATLFGVRHFYRSIEGESTHNTFWKKTELLLDILSALDFQQCMVFSNHQSIAQDLCDVLESRGWSSAFISGNLEQQQRIDIYNKLKNFQCRVLITTDLSARGIDAENVNLIINLELPWEFETYLHRMGRAGRYGSYGVVINIITREEMSLMNNIIDKCHIKMQLLPDNIPCDLLENRVSIDSVNNITVQKLEKNETSNDIYSLYRIFEKFKCNSENDCLLKEQITTVTEELDGTFDPIKIFHSYQNTNTNDFIITDLKSCTETIFNEDLFEIIKHTVYEQSRTRNDSNPTGPTGETTIDKHLIESDEDINKLEEELDRLSQWASFYSQKYQLCSDTISVKNCELNKLLSY